MGGGQNMHPELVPYGITISEVLSHRGKAENWELLSNIDAILSEKDDVSGLDSFLEHERHVYAIQGMLREVNNGGFSQFFGNSTGRLSNDLVAALKAVGSSEFLGVAEDALKLFGKPASLDDDARLDHISTITHDYEIPLWEECDGRFYGCSEQLEDMAIQYIAAKVGA